MAAACSVVAALLVAVVAIAVAFPGNIVEAFRIAEAGSTSPTRGRPIRTVLVAGQVAVAMVLLAGAGLFARSIITGLSLNPGYDTTRIVKARVSLGRSRYTTARAAAFFEDLLGRVRRNPAIRTVSLSTSWGGMSAGGKFIIDGQPRELSVVSRLHRDRCPLPRRSGRPPDERAPILGGRPRGIAAGGDRQ